MANRLKHSMVALVAAVAFSSVAVVAQNSQPANQKAGAQNPPKKAAVAGGGPAPARDLSGTWRGPTNPLLGARISTTPAGLAKLQLNIPDPFSKSSNDPWRTCDPFGMPRVANNLLQEIGFAQMPDRVIILENYGKVWREVWTDGRPLPKNVGHKGGPSPLWYGYSVGHWEGNNTFVVDTVGMDDKTWVDRRGYAHTVDAKVQERFERPDHNNLNFLETMDDPAYYTKPFAIAKANYIWIKGQDDPTAAVPFSDEQLYEQICIPSQFIEYNNLVADPADEDSAAGNKKPK